MKGFIEIREDSYEDTIEHLHRIKELTCKLIKRLSEGSEAYDDEIFEARGRGRSNRGRYGY